jgi:phosphoribosyl 1,2-cyclic phosphodiesterase
VLECNHDVEMLANGPYPYPLKRRVGGDFGHLSNAQAASLLAGVERGALQHLVAAHLSEQNNAPALARSALEGVLNGSAAQLHLADQESGCEWLRIA